MSRVQGRPWVLGNANGLSVFYERLCYLYLLRKFETFYISSMSNFVISGTNGVGKTIFGASLIRHFLNLPANTMSPYIVYDNLSDERACLPYTTL